MDQRREISFPAYPPTAGVFCRHVADTWEDRELVAIGDTRATFRESEMESQQLAKALLANGVQKGDHVGLLAPNGPEWIAACLAIGRIGAIAVLLNTYYKPRELDWVLDHADVELLLTFADHLGNDYAERLETISPELPGQAVGDIHLSGHPRLQAVWMWGDTDRGWVTPMHEALAEADTVSDRDLVAAEDAVTPDDPMVVIYSSGSTSDPKGVIHSHRATISHSHNVLPYRGLEPGDAIYTPMPLFWVGGLVWTLLSSMHAGAKVVFEERFEPGATLELLERERVTHVMGWPHMAKALTEHPSFGERDLSAVRGGALDELLPEHLRVGDPSRRAGSLGMTESLGPHSLEMIGSLLPPGKEGSFGRAVPGVERRIADPVTGDDMAPGELGELWIRGYSMMMGMLKRDDADVFEEGGWYKTGDGGYIDDDGHLYFKGRLGNVIKSSGTNVTPREVELVIEEQPDVMHAFVAAVPHHERGEDVAAAVVARPSRSIEPDDLRERVKAEIASYKVPRHIAIFATPQDLPWLDSGKIDLRAVQGILIDEFGDSQ